jgi:hypothetical protein
MYICRVAFVFKTALNESVWMNAGKAPSILSVVRCRRVVTVTLRSLYRRKNNVNPWTRGRVFRAGPDPALKRKQSATVESRRQSVKPRAIKIREKEFKLYQE